VVGDYYDPHSFGSLFPDYEGDANVESALEFIRLKMKALDRRAEGTLKFFTVVATQTPQVEAAFTSLLDV